VLNAGPENREKRISSLLKEDVDAAGEFHLIVIFIIRINMFISNYIMIYTNYAQISKIEKEILSPDDWNNSLMETNLLE
jgi:hypothetical protein